MKRKMISLFLGLVMLVTLVLPVSANEALPRIVDQAELLTPPEEASLEVSAGEFRDTYGLDIVVLTVDSLNGNTISAYADDYYDYQGYGMGPDASGLILVVAMAERELYISTCGEGIYRFSDKELDEMIDGTATKLSQGNYEEAFLLFIGFASMHADRDSGPAVRSSDAGVNWLLSLLIGIVVAGVAVLIMRACMNTRRKQHSAGDYLKSGSYHLRTRQDIFLYSNVSKVRRQQNNGGGSSTHRSSSGRSHGGRGGRF